VKIDSEGNVMRGTTGRPLYEERRGRKRWKQSAQVIEGGEFSIPLAHLGGSDAGEHPQTGEQRLQKRQTGTYRTRSAPRSRRRTHRTSNCHGRRTASTDVEC
jgi:hypothetical protein